MWQTLSRHVFTAYYLSFWFGGSGLSFQLADLPWTDFSPFYPWLNFKRPECTGEGPSADWLTQRTMRAAQTFCSERQESRQRRFPSSSTKNPSIIPASSLSWLHTKQSSSGFRRRSALLQLCSGFSVCGRKQATSTYRKKKLWKFDIGR